MTFHPAMLIPGGLALAILAGGAAIYLLMPEKASFIRLDAARTSPAVRLHITSLDPDRPFEWRADASGRGRSRGDLRQNPYDAHRFRIVCFQDRREPVILEQEVPAGRSRLVSVEIDGCDDLRLRSRRMPGL